MKKAIRVILTVIACLVALVVVLLAVAQAAVNSKLPAKIIDKTVAQYVDGQIGYDRIHLSIFSNFPAITLSVDSLRVVYPHDTFAGYDSLGVRSRFRDAGRGEDFDTLAAIHHIRAKVNPKAFLDDRILRADSLVIDGVRGFVHCYNDTLSNLSILHFPTSAEKDILEKSSSVNLPKISIGEFRLGKNSRVTYTSFPDTLFLSARLNRLALRGDVTLTGEGIGLDSLALDIDRLRASGRLPADTLNASVDSLHIRQLAAGRFALDLGARASMRSKAFGRIRLPLTMGGVVDYSIASDTLNVALDGFKAVVACLPLSVEGRATLAGAAKYVDVRASVDGCPVGTVIDEYIANFTDATAGVRSDALLYVNATAKGWMRGKQMPRVDASVRIPSSSFGYKPFGVHGKLDIDAAGADLLGADPRFKARALVDAKPDSAVYKLPVPVNATGDVHVDVDANVLLSEIKSDHFARGNYIRASVTSPHLVASMPADTLDADVYNADVSVSTNTSRILARVKTDSLLFTSGDGLRVRARGLRALAGLRGENAEPFMRPVTPGAAPAVAAPDPSKPLGRKYSVSVSAERLMARVPEARAFISNFAVRASLEHDRSRIDRRNSMLDSLQRVYPETPRDSLFRVMLRNSPRRAIPDYMSEKDFASSDIKVSVDTSITNLLREWAPKVSVSMERASLATPAIPLRTRLTGVEFSADKDSVKIDYLGATLGSSDLAVSGKLANWQRLLAKRAVIPVDLTLNVYSGRLNVNEVVAAMQLAKERENVTLTDSDDESFIVDNLEDAKIDSTKGLPLIVVPGNINGRVKVQADLINVAKLDVSPFKATINMKERCLQLESARLATDVGELLLGAFYSTRTKQDISCGADLSVRRASAEGIMQILPFTENLMPMLRSFKGNLNLDVSATTQLDTNMFLVMPSLNAMFKITGEDLEIQDAGEVKKITRLLLFKNPDIGKVADLCVSGIISDNKLEVFPFVIGADRYTIALNGVQGFDKSMNYHASILTSPLPFKLGVNVYGSLDNWKFKMGPPVYNADTLPVYEERLDSMHVNLAYSIRNIYRKGADEVMKESRNIRERLASGTRTRSGRPARVGVDAAPGSAFAPASADSTLSSETYANLDSLQTLIDASLGARPASADSAAATSSSSAAGSDQASGVVKSGSRSNRPGRNSSESSSAAASGSKALDNSSGSDDMNVLKNKSKSARKIDK